MKHIYLKELRRNFKSWVIWTVALSIIITVGMIFYPIFMEGNLISEMRALFETPIMNTLLAGFGADIATFSDLLGFYVTYGAIYNTLLGAVYSTLLASNIVSKEENNKTAEFLLSKPVTRNEVYSGKLFAYFTFLIAINIVLFFVGIVNFEIFKTDNSLKVRVGEDVKTEIVSAMEKHPQVYKDIFVIKESMILNAMISKLERQADPIDPQTLDELGIEAGTISQMLKDLKEAQSISDFYENVKSEPEKYMKMMNMTGISKEQFLKLIEQQERQFYGYLEEVKTNPKTFIELFKTSTQAFMRQLKGKPELIDEFITRYELNSDIEHRVFVYYEVDKYMVISVYSLLVMLTFGAIGLFISLLVKRGKSIWTIAIGITLGAYFINVISNMTKEADFIGYISPFKFSDTNVIVTDYGFDWWRLLYFIGLSAVLLIISAIIYRRKDILI